MSSELNGRRPRVLAAPDSFKGTFSAGTVAAAIAAGVESVGGQATVCPLADGGEGTAAVLRTMSGGTIRRASVHDPLGRPVEAELSLLGDGDVAVVDLASASGLPLLAPSERDPLLATTFGTGELIVAALAQGARKVLVAAGGSATVDGGRGAMEALEAAGVERPPVEILSDTNTPFELAAETFGPQKGADPAGVRALKDALDRLAVELPRDPRGVPMGGAAGGFAGGFWAAYGCRLRSGAKFVFEAVGLDSLIADADLVVTGEGRLDQQSLDGKLVGQLARRCRAARTPLGAIVGTDRLGEEAAARAGIGAVFEAGERASIQRAAADLVAERS